jgi:hypothetical protein
LLDKLVPRLGEEVQRLQKKDFEQYAEGRRELGIIMELKSTVNSDYVGIYDFGKRQRRQRRQRRFLE